MHGTEHCNPERRAHCPSASPVSDFAATGSKRPRALQLSPGRGWILVTAFRSPATTAAFTASIPGSTFLACYFASVSINSAARLIIGSATDPRFAPRPAASTLQTRCSFLDQLDLPRPRPPLPFRTVRSLGSKRSAGPAAVQPAFRFRPISVRSPLPVSITSYDCGSMFPVRYVLGGLLFLKPLGTFINMLPNLLRGQSILCSPAQFSSTFTGPIFLVFGARKRWIPCE